MENLGRTASQTQRRGPHEWLIRARPQRDEHLRAQGELLSDILRLGEVRDSERSLRNLRTARGIGKPLEQCRGARLEGGEDRMPEPSGELGDEDVPEEARCHDRDPREEQYEPLTDRHLWSAVVLGRWYLGWDRFGRTP